MGWKISLALIKDSPHKTVSEIAKALGFDKAGNTLVFERAMHPAEQISLGIYQETAIIASSEMAEAVVQDGLAHGDWDRKLIQAFPNQEILVAGLHSVVNYAAYALFRNGKKIRSFACTGDDGVVFDEGDRWIPEACVFDRSTINRDGTRVIKDGEDEIPIDCYGEELVFQLSQYFLGFRLDNGPDGFYDLPMTLYSDGRPWWKRLFSRS